MLPFSVSLQSGIPVSDQVVYAVVKAVVTGQLREGDAFPSVRVLSQELGINPNTAHRIVTALIDDGVLAARPGIGTVVADRRGVHPAARRDITEHQAEALVLAARRAGLSLDDLLGAVRRQWKRMVR